MIFDLTDVRYALRKLLSYNYYDKNDLVSRRSVADFVNSISSEEVENDVLSKICDVANGKRHDLLESWERDIHLAFYPKTLNTKRKVETTVITNVPDKDIEVDRLLVKCYFPVEILILDTLWVLKYGYLIDRELDDKSCWGNRLDLTAGNREVKLGDALFKRYHNQYRNWWENGLKAANIKLKEDTDVSIITFDISNCYHSIDFDFEALFKEQYISEFADDPLQSVIKSIYIAYWTKAKHSNLKLFKREVCHPLPLNLLSAHILANWFLSPIERHVNLEYKPLYFGRYVDDCMLVCEAKSSGDDIYESICQELPGLFVQNKEIGFAPQDLSMLSMLSIQDSKLFLYRFDCQLPQPIIEDSLNDFIERSSEYRFLTEDEDPYSSSLEDVTLVNALEPVEDAGKRFNILEENRFLLSVYLSKLATQLSVYGSSYQNIDEVYKIFKYFQDSLIVKHYLMWERIFTVFVLAGENNLVDEFYKRCAEVICRITFHESLNTLSEEDVNNLRKTLENHLNESLLMAVSLMGKSQNVPSVYLDTYMIRMRFNRYPMQEFTDDFTEKGLRISFEDFHFEKKLFEYRWLPYYKPLYEIVTANSLGGNYDPQKMKESFECYRKLNRITDNIGIFDVLCHTDKERWAEFNTKIHDNERDKDKLTVAVIEIDIKKDEAQEVITHQSTISKDKIEVIRGALDNVTKADADIFIMPELSLPFYMLNEVCRYSAKRKKALVAGLEYYVSGDEVNNYFLTFLPISLYGRKDVLPVIRLKNHYAPNERIFIEKKCKLKVPKVSTNWQMLFHWRGHVFTTYLCYELTDIKDRSYFFSKIDAMYSSVFNQDTYYFNNIAESCSRDMHCFYIQSNVSHLGDSRVTRPSHHYDMNLLKVTGGNTSKNKCVVLTCEIDIKGIRQFQKKDISDQKADDTYKFTPPSYSKEIVRDREQKRFVMPFESKWEEMMAELTELFLKY